MSGILPHPCDAPEEGAFEVLEHHLDLKSGEGQVVGAWVRVDEFVEGFAFVAAELARRGRSSRRRRGRPALAASLRTRTEIT